MEQAIERRPVGHLQIMIYTLKFMNEWAAPQQVILLLLIGVLWMGIWRVAIDECDFQLTSWQLQSPIVDRPSGIRYQPSE